MDLIRRRFKNPGKVSTIGHRVLKPVANAGTPAKGKGLLSGGCQTGRLSIICSRRLNCLAFSMGEHFDGMICCDFTNSSPQPITHLRLVLLISRGYRKQLVHTMRLQIAMDDLLRITYHQQAIGLQYPL